MNVDSEHSFAISVALLIFIIYPRAVKCLGSYQHNRHGGSVELTIDPTLDRFIALVLKSLPVGVVDEARLIKSALGDTAVPHLTHAEDVTTVAEAEEYSSRHKEIRLVDELRMTVRDPLVEMQESRGRFLIVNV